MLTERRAPTTLQVIRAISQRELATARRRRLVKWLFILSLLPPVVVAVVLVVMVLVEKQGFTLDWDPVLRFFQAQLTPVIFLSLGIGTPCVARDRAEDVLFLYATRPVSPSAYALGKMFAVAVPTGLLFWIPGVLIATLQYGLVPDQVGFAATIGMILKVTMAAILIAWGLAGVAVGSSATATKARWAMLIAFACLAVPNIISDAVWFGDDTYALGPLRGCRDLLYALFETEEGWFAFGVAGTLALAAWGAAGLFVTRWRMRQEMTP